MPSYGYGGPIAADVWSQMQQCIGVDYAAAGLADCKVSPNSTGVQIAVGAISGWGVMDVLTAPVSVALAAPGSGQTWWMIVARRTWGVTKATTFVGIAAGSAAPSVLPARNSSPGAIDDQPLALVGWSAGQAQPGTVIDLRVCGMAGQHLAFDQRALQYLTDPGRQVRIGSTDWVCQANGASLEWVQSGGGAGGRVAFSTSSPAGAGWYQLRGDSVELHYESTGTVPAGSQITITTLPTPYRPGGKTAIAAAVGASGTRVGASVVATSGVWVVYNAHSSAAPVYAHGTYPRA